MMHIFENDGYVSGDSYSFFGAYLHGVFLHVKQIEKTSLLYKFENDVNVWNFRDNTHQHGNVWVSKDALHHNFVLNFLQELVCYSWVDDFLDGDWGAIEFTIVDDRETTLAYLISNF